MAAQLVEIWVEMWVWTKVAQRVEHWVGVSVECLAALKAPKKVDAMAEPMAVPLVDDLDVTLVENLEMLKVAELAV